ncbi:dynein axonemal intermediate chain 3-like isoform X2 [Babylonia areolata]|uniref:dynein axonemal intermediate chain 3-like isoform X2 n=1 Tax=Babylonia areolata TaxID=304850 RepID=UPI003FD48421
MADADQPAEVTDKEKESAQKEEKEEDTAAAEKPATPKKPKSPKKRSPSPGSKPGSPKPGSAKGGHAKPGKGKHKKEEVKPEPPPTTDDEKEEVLPENCAPLFMTSKSQEIYHCQCDSDVTEENPHKIIAKQEILDDMRNRAAVCDFHPFKQQIMDYPGDEILIVYDYDFKFGQNFYIALTEEAKDLILNPPEEVKEGEEGEAAQPEEEVVYHYIPPEPKEWVSQGSEAEIAEENVVDTRGKVKVSVKRLRRHFGAPCTFKNRNSGDTKQGVIECLPYEDKTFDLKKVELTTAVQAVPVQEETGTQTDWKYPRNANTQYYPREFSTQELEKVKESDDLADFIKKVEPRFQLALQQNAIMNVFYDDWVNLGDADDAFGSKADSHLKEYQSFTDLNFSKDKTITCIQWHPSIKGVVAVSIAERLTFDERIDQAAKVIMTPSLILIWSFTDPIHPQLILEAPEDIFCFSFCPTDPNVITGGCYNGQVIMWDISAHVDRLKAPRGGNRNKRLNVLPGFEDPNALKTPIVRYCAVSSIENSHKAAITDIQWMPDHMLISRMGVPHENKSGQCAQVITCATDNCVLFWDIRAAKGQQAKDFDDKGLKNPMGVPNTFRHLDLTWKPMLKMYLSKSEPGGDHAPIKFSMQERQGDRSVLTKVEDEKEKDATATMGGGFTAGIAKPGSGKERTLQGVQTYLYIGTEDGEIVYGDWMPQKDQDTGKLQTPKPSYYHSLHDGPVISLNRSPFLKEVVLSVGGWTWAIWKEGVSSGCILQSAAAPVRLSAGYWSPTRPSVFYIAKQDGSVDVWDLLDKTHEPSLTQSVSPAPITNIFPYQVTQKQQLLAVGDNSGTLHILEIPWSLRQPTPGELNGVTNYIEREVKRRAFVVSRWNLREQEKQEMAQEAKRKAGIAPNVQLTDEQIEANQKQEYQAYLNDEFSFLRELGIIKEEEEALPEV